jgi:TonB family protein
MATPNLTRDRKLGNNAQFKNVQFSNVQFKDFGVLDTGRQSKASTLGAIVLNLAILALIVAFGAVAKEKIDTERRLTVLTLPIVQPLPEPVQPKIVLKPLPPTPVVKTEPPRIKLPEVKPLEVPKPAEAKMTQPLPVVTPAAPKKIVAPPAPQVVSLARPVAASVVNDSQHPTAIALGRADSPIAVSNRPATAAVNLGQRGMPGMPSSNSGGGPAATAVNLGSGSPGGQTLAGNGTRPVQGIRLGSNNASGPSNSTGHVGQVNLGQVQQVAMARPAGTIATAPQSVPKVLWKPKPAYTPEATALHINGVVQVRIRVSATGTVTVLAVTRPLGYGLDQSAERAAGSMRFAPAVDANGHPVDWEGNVTVTFQSESNG